MKNRRRTLVAVVAGLASVGALAAPVIASTSGPAPAVAQSASDVRTGLDATLEDRLATTPASQPVLVFVHAADTAAAADAASDAGLTVIERFERVGVAVVAGLPDAVRALEGDQRVLRVEADRELEWYLDTSHEATRGAEVIAGFEVTTTPGRSGIKAPHAPREPATSTSTHAYDGSDVSIAIVDSGIDATHPFFLDDDGTSKVARNLDLYCSDALLLVADDQSACSPAWVDDPYGDTDSNSAGGHGTHVAGIAGGYETVLDDGRTIMGAAPGSTLIGLSVGATISVYGGASGLNWVLENHADPCGDGSCPPIKVVNNSWGSGGADHDPGGVHAKIVNALVEEEDVVVVFAQGNDGGDGSANESNPHALNPTPGVLGVANYDDGGTGTRDGALSASSSRGQEGRPSTYPDIAAPGTNILSACRVYQPICSTGLDFVENGDYNTISGTSMAAPHIAGIVAQLFEADPSLTPAEIEDVLEDTAHKFASGGAYENDVTNPDDTTSFDKGHGLVDVVAAVSDVLGLDAPAATSECTADGPVITDAEGDATTYLGAPNPLGNQPALDVLEGRITENGETLEFALLVSDLSEEPPTGSTGEHFDWNFTYEGAAYFLSVNWDRSASPEYVLGRFNPTRETLAEIQGNWDVDTDTVTAFLPLEQVSNALAALGETVEPMTTGSVLAGHQIVSRYQQVVLVPDVDTADGACPYTIGLGAVAAPVEDPGDEEPVTEPPSEPGDATLSDGETVTFEADPGTALNDPIVGSVAVSADPSTSYTIDVTTAGGAALVIDAVADQPELQDIDLVVYDQSGAVVATSKDVGGAESVTIAEPTTQRYTIQVDRYLTVEAGYTVTATLGTP